MEIILNNNLKKEYPFIHLPDIVLNHIQNGYSESEILSFLKLKKPKKQNHVSIVNWLRYFSYSEYESITFTTLLDRGYVIYLDTILNLEYDSVSESLECNEYWLGKYKLPKKPNILNYKEIEYIDYSLIFTGFLKSLLIIPTIVIFQFLIYVFAMVIYMFMYGKHLEFPTKLIAIITISIYSILGIFLLVSTEFEKRKRFVDIKLKEAMERKKLIDNYKDDVKSIIKKYNIDYQNKLKEFKKIYYEKEQLAEIGILKEMISQQNYYNLISLEGIQKGKSEIYFLKYLYDEFERNVLTDYSPDVGLNPFQPDFIIQDNETGVFLDIEIDEPYSLINGRTIHHNRTKDEERNLFFNEMNWGVIRFTEKQVIESPKECVSLIKSVINAIKNRNQYISHNIKIEKFWTHEEALIMKMNDFRNSYLRNTGFNN